MTDPSPSPYATVAAAIRYLEANARRQPTLAEVAASVHLSEFHFQRLFTRWAGISPKRFLQFQTVVQARQVLDESRSVLDAAWELGLSSASRLHDLLVTTEAVTPGDVRRGGEGLEIVYGVHDSPFGECALAVTPRGICDLLFRDEGAEAMLLAELRRRWPRADVRRGDARTLPLARRIFARPSAGAANASNGTHAGDGAPAHDGPHTGLAGAGAAAPPLRLHLRGTNFQLKVWEALLRIPPGAAVSYGTLARAAGAPTAVRAVGSAVGDNPVAWIIPCHRVLRASGAFGQYRGGTTRKRAMLAWEWAPQP